jgi:hypothetical protein
MQDGNSPQVWISVAPATPNGQSGWYTHPVYADASLTQLDDPAWITIRCALDPAPGVTTYSALPSGPCPYAGNRTPVVDGKHRLVVAASNTKGTSALVDVTLLVDTQPPTASPVRNLIFFNPLNPSTGMIQVTWNWADQPGASGINPATCPPMSFVTGDPSTVITATCQDLAGNTATATSKS